VAVHQTPTEACAEGREGSRASHRLQLGARRLLLDGGDWQWANGYWFDQPWSDAVWMPATERSLVGLDMGSRLLVLSEAQAR